MFKRKPSTTAGDSADSSPPLQATLIAENDPPMEKHKGKRGWFRGRKAAPEVITGFPIVFRAGSDEFPERKDLTPNSACHSVFGALLSTLDEHSSSFTLLPMSRLAGQTEVTGAKGVQFSKLPSLPKLKPKQPQTHIFEIPLSVKCVSGASQPDIFEADTLFCTPAMEAEIAKVVEFSKLGIDGKHWKKAKSAEEKYAAIALIRLELPAGKTMRPEQVEAFAPLALAAAGDLWQDGCTRRALRFFVALPQASCPSLAPTQVGENIQPILGLAQGEDQRFDVQVARCLARTALTPALQRRSSSLPSSYRLSTVFPAIEELASSHFTGHPHASSDSGLYPDLTSFTPSWNNTPLPSAPPPPVYPGEEPRALDMSPQSAYC